MSDGISRRAFLAGGASFVGAGTASMLLPGVAVAVGSGVRTGLALRRSAFVPLVGQAFEIAHDRGSLRCVLAQVDDLQPTSHPGAEDQFSLIFSDARLRLALRQGTYLISHARQGRIYLFVAPVDRRRTAQHYQATIDTGSRTTTP